MSKVKRVTVSDTAGNTFSRDWKITAKNIDAIRWTIESQDLPHYVNEMAIENVVISYEQEA